MQNLKYLLYFLYFKNPPENHFSGKKIREKNMFDTSMKKCPDYTHIFKPHLLQTSLHMHKHSQTLDTHVSQIINSAEIP